jgi:hypothetical protein
MGNENDLAEPVKVGVEVLGEYVVPGGSNLVKGDMAQGAIHAVLGLVARAAFGFPGVLLVSANSLAKATTGRHLWEHLGMSPTLPASLTSDADTSTSKGKAPATR